ncbi:MAG: MMPL family transporter [bacterium]|nr:MMPL family transporter [bacterium]
MIRLIQFFVNRSLLGNFITVVVIISAIIALMNMEREQFPGVDYDFVLVTTVYRGATTEEVEQFVTIPIEKELISVSGIKKSKSNTLESMSEIIITLEPDLENKTGTIQDIRDAVSRVESDLPEGIDEPVITELTSARSPVIDVALYWKDQNKNLNDHEQETILRKYAKLLANSLERVDQAAAVDKRGYRDREIFVEVDPKKMKENFISFEDIYNSIDNRNISYPGGNITDRGIEHKIRTSNQFKNTDEIKSLVLRTNDMGYAVRINDVAGVRDSFEEEEIIEKANGNKAIILTVRKKEKGDAIKATDAVKKIVKEFKAELKKELPENISGNLTIILINDSSSSIKQRLQNLSSNVIIGMILVLISLFFFLGWRIASMVVVGIPFAFGIAFLLMSFFGLTLNVISLFGLVIVSGMLVDDAIIVAENIYSYIEQGIPPLEAAVSGTKEMVPPLMASISTTMMAFLPLMFMGGMMGKYIWAIPAVVIIALAASLLESFFILPSHVADVMPAKSKENAEPVFQKNNLQSNIFKKLQERYFPVLNHALNRPFTAVIIVSVLFFMSLGLAKMVGYKMSSAGMPAFHVLTEAEEGVSLKEMSRRMSSFEKIVGQLPKHEVDGFITRVGIQKPDIMDPFFKRGKQYSQLTIYLTPLGIRDRKGTDIMKALRADLEKKNKQLGYFTKIDIKQEHSGPPIGSPIQLKIKGEDAPVVLNIADQVKKELNSIKGVYEIRDNRVKAKDVFHVVVNEKIASRAGVSVKRIAHTLQANYEGVVASTVKKGQEDIKIRIIYPEKLREQISSLNTVMIKNTMGNLVNINAFARFEKRPGVAVINHDNRERVIYINAEVDKTKNTPVSANTDILERAGNIMKKYPGYSLETGGEMEDTKESMGDLGMAALFALLGIIIILVLLFNNFRNIRVVIVSVPLSFIGVAIAFSINKIFNPGLNFTFVATLGIVALSGIVLNDSIVLVTAINNLVKKGTKLKDAVLQGASSRLRPILLTTITTLLGLLPMAYSLGGTDPFLEPMALALSWGLLFGTLVTLLVIPALYLLWEDRAAAFKKGFTKLYKKALNTAQKVQKASIGLRVWTYFYDKFILRIFIAIWLVLFSFLFLPEFSGNIRFNPHGEGLVISGTRVSGGEWLIFFAGIFILSILWRLVMAFLESRYHSPSRRALGIIVVDNNGNRIGFLKSFVRSLFKIFPLGIITLISMELNPDGKGIHDRIMGTEVIQPVQEKNI